MLTRDGRREDDHDVDDCDDGRYRFTRSFASITGRTHTPTTRTRHARVEMKNNIIKRVYFNSTVPQCRASGVCVCVCE